MPDYIKIRRTLQKLNLSHLEDTFKAYGIHDDVILTLTSSQLRSLLPNMEKQFRQEFLMLCDGSDDGTPDSKKEFLHHEKSTQTESDNEILPSQKAAKSKSGEMSEKTKKNLKTAGIVAGSVIGASALAVVAAPVAIAAAGFGSAGVVGGSIAAAWQATMGGYIATSSLFATLQSVGVIGLSSAATAVVGISGGAVGGATAAGIVALTNKSEKKDQGTQTTDTKN